jgi:hypothetical protein
MLYIYLGAAIFYLLSIGGAGWYGLEQGKKLERVEWLEQAESINKGVAKIVQHVRAEEDANRSNLILAIGKGQKENERITANYNNLLNERMRFKTSRAASCDKPMPGKDQSPSVSDGTVEIELPTKTERSLRAIARDAEYELANCNALRDIISPVIEVIGYAE